MGNCDKGEQNNSIPFSNDMESQSAAISSGYKIFQKYKSELDI